MMAEYLERRNRHASENKIIFLLMLTGVPAAP